MRRSAMCLVLAACAVNPAFDPATSGAAGESTSGTSTGAPLDPTTGLDPSTTAASTSLATTGSVEPASTSTSSTSSTSTTDETTTGGSTGDEEKDVGCPDHDALIACYTFPADAGDDLVDGSPNGLDGPKLFTNPVTGPPGHGPGVEFLVQSDVFAKSNEKFTTKYFTISTFAFIKDGGPGKALIDKQDHYGLLVDNGEATCVVRNDSKTTTTVQRPIPVEQWIHLSCSFDGAEVRLRVYGPGAPPEPGVAALPGILDPDVDSELRLGWDPPGLTNKFNGKLDHVLIFSEALSDDELCQLAAPLCP